MSVLQAVGRAGPLRRLTLESGWRTAVVHLPSTHPEHTTKNAQLRLHLARARPLGGRVSRASREARCPRGGLPAPPAHGRHGAGGGSILYGPSRDTYRRNPGGWRGAAAAIQAVARHCSRGSRWRRKSAARPRQVSLQGGAARGRCRRSATAPRRSGSTAATPPTDPRPAGSLRARATEGRASARARTGGWAVIGVYRA